MKLASLALVVFSPTRTTKTIAEAVALGIGADEVCLTNLTLPGARKSLPARFDSDAVLLAAPVYYGRLPVSVVPVFKRLEGQGKPVILLVVYGNRDYEDALAELYDISVSQGFVPAAAGAFVAEHSYSLPDRPMAAGRPDAADLETAKDFGRAVRQKLAGVDGPGMLSPLQVPGNRPYLRPEKLYMIQEIRKTMAFAPETGERCTQCGICRKVCPEGAIDAFDAAEIDPKKCILCFACVKSCPEQAKAMRDPNFNAAVGQLAEIIQNRKEPEVFL